MQRTVPRRRGCNRWVLWPLALLLIGLSLLTALHVRPASGSIILFNGTSSAGKSSLAKAMLQESKTRYEVISFDDFERSYKPTNGTAGRGYDNVMLALYRHVKAEADAGKNVIIDTVEFDRNYDRYCEILNCANVIKVIVYCPLEHLLKRIEKRNNDGSPGNHRLVLLAYDQFVQMYKPQSSPQELVVARTNTSVLRDALAEAGLKAGNARQKQYQDLYKNYVRVFGIDQDRELIIVPKGKYDLVVNTKSDSKKKNVQRVEDYMNSQR
jgi:chloramphenicol 3-O-phosphotransferase